MFQRWRQFLTLLLHVAKAGISIYLTCTTVKTENIKATKIILKSRSLPYTAKQVGFKKTSREKGPRKKWGKNGKKDILTKC